MAKFGKQHPKIKQKRLTFDETGSVPIEILHSEDVIAPLSKESILKTPVYRSRIIFVDKDVFTLDLVKTSRPNPWWRLWHWVFFGIKWERIDKNG